MPAEKNTGVRKPGKSILGAGEALGCQDFAKTGQFGNALAVQAPQREHQAITNHDAGHAHGKHGVHIGVAQTRDDTARDQGHIFRNGDTKAADQQHHKHGQIAVFGEDGHQKLKNFHG
jgi:hypothetical protein